jgi:hypothetical protein
MMDEIREAGVAALTGAGVGGIGGVARLIVLGVSGGLLQWVSSLAASGFMGALVYMVLLDNHPASGVFASPSVRLASAAIAAFVAKDLFAGLRNLSAEFAKDPIGLVRSIWQGLRGK